MNTQFAAAFDNSFAGFVSGSMTAKQAFDSFTTSILSDIAKIIAQELRVQAIKGLINLFGSIFIGTAPSTTSNVGNTFKLGSGASGAITPPLANLSNSSSSVRTSNIIPLNRPVSQSNLSNSSNQKTSSGGINIESLNVHVVEKEGTSSEEQSKLIGQAIKSQLKGLIQQELVSSSRPGGTLNQTQMATAL
jgi:hypothetical protein